MFFLRFFIGLTWQHLVQSGLSRMDYWKKYKPVGISYGWIFNMNTDLFVKTISNVKKLLHTLTRSIEICHQKHLLMDMQFGNYRNTCKIYGIQQPLLVAVSRVVFCWIEKCHSKL